jgi:hypothetical protein
MKHLKKFLEMSGWETAPDWMSKKEQPSSTEDISLRRNKQDTEVRNKQMVTREWLENHPFDGVESISANSHYVTINFDRGYISISNLKEDFYDPKGAKSYKMKEKESVSTNLTSDKWKELISKKDEFLTWVDKLLIFCDMDRQAMRQLLVVMSEKERYNNW